MLILTTFHAQAKYTDSFIVKVKDRSIQVTSPPKKIDIVSVIIENETLDKIISQLKTKDKVIKRFVLQPEGKQVIQVDLTKTGTLYYVPLSPPSQEVVLKFAQGPYEVPEKD